MSSTKRGGKRIADDVYETQEWCVHRLFDELQTHRDVEVHRAIEPCAATGAIVRAARSWGINRIDGHRLLSWSWTAFEIREECRAPVEALGLESVTIGDFLTRPNRNYKWDLLLTNPPFSLAMEFVRASEKIATHRIFLFRLNFLGSEERSSYMRETRPDLYVLPNRPSFAASLKCVEFKELYPADPADAKCGWSRIQSLSEERPRLCPDCGGRVTCTTSDSIEYAWFHWHPGCNGRWTMLNDTPAAERKG